MSRCKYDHLQWFEIKSQPHDIVDEEHESEIKCSDIEISVEWDNSASLSGGDT